MFAVIAAIIFLLHLLGLEVGSIDLVVLGLFFVAVHLAWGWTPWIRRP